MQAREREGGGTAEERKRVAGRDRVRGVPAVQEADRLDEVVEPHVPAPGEGSAFRHAIAATHAAPASRNVASCDASGIPGASW